LLESDVRVQQATNNTKEQLSNSPDLASGRNSDRETISPTTEQTSREDDFGERDLAPQVKNTMCLCLVVAP
jgi:hypothetical protein